MPTIQIPQGNTSAQVNETVFQELQPHLKPGSHLVDVPSGQGEWLQFLAEHFPEVQFSGFDIHPQVTGKGFEYKSMDLTRQSLPQSQYDLATSISGIVCFGNHLHFFRSIHESLKPGGRLFLTNDNHWTLRDRVQFLLFGHFKRFPLVYRPGEGNTQNTSQMAVLDGLSKAGFKVEMVRYMSIRPEDWIWLPLCLALYIFQALKIFSSPEHPNFPSKWNIYAPLGLLARHYLIVARKV